MKLLLALSIIFCGVVASAQTPSPEWKWYFAGFCSPSPQSELCTRAGTASISRTNTEVTVALRQKDYPEMQARFSGKLSASGAINGVLTGFFPSGAEVLAGAFRQKGSVKTCHWQEITLRSSVPDGALLVLTRIDGPCQ
jgi:hypothetical protein